MYEQSTFATLGAGWRIEWHGSHRRASWGKKDGAALALLSVLGILAAWPVAPLTSLDKIQGGDATIQAYILGWGADNWLLHPLRYFDLPAFYPNQRALANMDSLLLPAILVSPVWWATGQFILTYNIAILLSYIFDLFAFYLVLRAITPVPRSAAMAASVLFTVNINHYWHASQHLNLLWTGVLPIAFLAGWILAARPCPRSTLLSALALFASLLFSWYLLIFSCAAWAAGALAAFLCLRPRPSFRLALWGAAAVTVSALLVAPIVWAYATAPGERRVRGTLAECERFSVAAQDWIVPPYRPKTIAVPLGKLLAPSFPPQEGAADDPVFVGWIFSLALLAECYRLGSALVRRRFGILDRLSLLASIGAAISILLSLGPWLDPSTGRVRGPYWFLHATLFHAAAFFRTPMRFAFLFQLFSGLMVAAYLASGWRAGRLAGRLLGGILILSAYSEHWPGKTWFRDKPRQISVLSDLDRIDPARKQAFIALPDSGVCEAGLSTHPGWRPMANGFPWSPLAPDYEAFIGAMDDFPSTRSLAHLDKRGVEWIIAMNSKMIQRARDSAQVEAIAVRDDEALIHSLSKGSALQAWERERSRFHEEAARVRAPWAESWPGLIHDFLQAPDSARAGGAPGGLRLLADLQGDASFTIPLEKGLPPLAVDEFHVTVRASEGIENSRTRMVWSVLDGRHHEDLVQTGSIRKEVDPGRFTLVLPVHLNAVWLKGPPVRLIRVDLLSLPPSPDLKVDIERIVAVRLPEAPSLPF